MVGRGGERAKGFREKDKQLRGTAPGRKWHNRPYKRSAMPVLSSRRHASALPHIWYQVVGLARQVHLERPRRHASALPYIWYQVVGLARQVDLERPHVCNACAWHSLYLVHMASTNSTNRCPSACSLLLVATGMAPADFQGYIDFTRFEMYVHGRLMRQT